MNKLLVETFTLGPLATNAYLISEPTENKAIIIDPGMQPQSLIERITDLQIEAILLTHAHLDHIGGVDEIRKLKKCPVYLHSLESKWLTDPELNGSTRWPELGAPIYTDPAEFTLEEGQTLHFLGAEFKVFHTPGHSPGSVSFLLEDDIFSGDVLFQHSMGRTDLPGGNSEQLYESIYEKLFVLEDKVKVHPGHGPSTTIGHEREHNPFL
ncbi:MBL fold metallo-hydrolase [Chengkuizengella axinellae]|uniref:MBL fold metallo-hydrolase n=1 Tax=Chengkuizengella axinellae TaxID=3064388 RepID=A0ABT9J5W2_9BACL|nr:MBL fold metallo-hydrolase [Chengkuizengella sp. 2205SS18-9]MDP5277016.1 MBL fold metallo-hydrolase [Chengkuizengella sp. 2205SS18-9]